jgi:TetR/AcrR family transcriptional repressor of bet genes
MEPIRRDALVKAAIAEIGAAGSLDVTVSRIARRAGVSSALAHHYFGAKDQLFLAAMRHVLGEFAAEVRRRLRPADGPRARVAAIIEASFAEANFRPDTVAAWLNFYVLAQSDDAAQRLLRVYQRRLRSNLLAGLRPMLGARAPAVAEGLGALIDGVYIRQALAGASLDPAEAVALALGYLDMECHRAGGR